VFADRIPPDHESLNYVIQDDYNAALNAVKHLHQKGCSNLGCVSFDLFASSIQNRLGGFKDGLKACGLAFEPDNMMLLKEQNHDSEDLYTLLKNASQQRPPIDGLVVTTEGLAHKIGFLLSNTDLELRDLAIVKFGKDPKYFKTGMTEIVQPNVEMGRIAAANLLGLINNYITSPVQIKLESKLIQE
jgi:DNA-binding LacI/PurR family transcriptional regulator